MPDRSGLPSAALGAGASSRGVPAAVFGTPGVGCFSHCASNGVPATDASAMMKGTATAKRMR